MSIITARGAGVAVKFALALIEKIVSKEEATRIFEEDGYQDKIEILKYRPEKTCHLYECDGYQNYMYSRMVPSTGYINKWKILFYMQ